VKNTDETGMKVVERSTNHNCSKREQNTHRV